MSAVTSELLTIVGGLPGQWQYWCDAEESGACWVVPADEHAQQAMHFTSHMPRDFMKVRKATLSTPVAEEEFPPPLF